MAKFDWQTIVERNKPAPGSPTGRMRLDLLPGLLSDLKNWAGYYNLRTTRLKESAYTGVVTFSNSSPYNPAFLLAKYILWTFNLDVFIDRFDYFRFDPSSPEKWLEYFDSQLDQILSPLYQVGGLTHDQAVSYGLQPDLEPVNIQIEEISLTLGKVLLDLYESLAAWAEHDTEANLSFTLENFTRQIARMIGAMRGELIQNYQHQQSRESSQLPELNKYLEQSKLSIGLRPGGAIAVGFAAESCKAWAACDAAMDTATRIVRLANDISSYWSEVEEHKVTSVTVALATLGFDPTGNYHTDSPEIKKAYSLVQNLINQELERYSREIEEVPPNPLRDWLQLTLAFAVAMYAEGNYIVPS